MIGQPDNHPLAQNTLDRTLNRLARLFVSNSEYLMGRSSSCLRELPASHFLGDRIHEVNQARGVRDDNAVADARKSHAKEIFLLLNLALAFLHDGDRSVALPQRVGNLAIGPRPEREY